MTVSSLITALPISSRYVYMCLGNLCTAMVFSVDGCGQSVIMSHSFGVCTCVCRTGKSDAIQCNHGSNSS